MFNIKCFCAVYDGNSPVDAFHIWDRSPSDTTESAVSSSVDSVEEEGVTKEMDEEDEEEEAQGETHRHGKFP